MLIVGQIVDIQKHPDPKVTRLRITKVDVGTHELQIVTAAPNIELKQKVVVAMLGHEFPDFKIELRKLRGVESYGMYCGDSDLGLPPVSDGIAILNDYEEIGKEFIINK